MLNPFGPQQDPSLSSYVKLRKRMFQNVQAARVNDQIFEVVQRVYEDALKKENIPLTRPEKTRLLAQIMKLILTDMVTKLDESS
jgi:hypothetical protein